MRMRRIASDWLYSEPFWYDLVRAGFGATVLDVPFSFENRLPRAVEVINWGSHDLLGRFQTNPPGLRREIVRRFGRHPMGYEIPVSKDTGQLAAMTRECVDGAGTKARLACWLRETTNWDFFLAVFGECHRGGHILWRDHDDVHAHVPKGALLEVYRAVDAGVGTLLEGIDTATTTVVVFALHGMGHNFSQEHFVRRALDRVNARYWRESAPPDDPARENAAPGRRGLIRALRESIPPSLQHRIARSVPVGVRDWVAGREVTGGRDWRRTPGIALRSDLFSFLRLNLAGRERSGALGAGSDAHRRYVEQVTDRFSRTARGWHERADRARRHAASGQISRRPPGSAARSAAALDRRVPGFRSPFAVAGPDPRRSGLGAHGRTSTRRLRPRARPKGERRRAAAARAQQRFPPLRFTPARRAPAMSERAKAGESNGRES